MLALHQQSPLSGSDGTVWPRSQPTPVFQPVLRLPYSRCFWPSNNGRVQLGLSLTNLSQFNQRAKANLQSQNRVQTGLIRLSYER